MTIAPIAALDALQSNVETRVGTRVFAVALSGALDGVAQNLARADALAASVAIGRGSIADAAIARAKADVALEIAAVAASRVTAAISTLMQTQV